METKATKPGKVSLGWEGRHSGAPRGASLSWSAREGLATAVLPPTWCQP